MQEGTLLKLIAIIGLKNQKLLQHCIHLMPKMLILNVVFKFFCMLLLASGEKLMRFCSASQTIVTNDALWIITKVHDKPVKIQLFYHVIFITKCRNTT